jgi:RNA binding exosome subunit
MADEIVDVMKTIVENTSKQDQALLSLCKAMIERIIAIEERETALLGALTTQMSIIKIHTETNTKIREVMKSLLARVDSCEEHNASLFNSVIILKELVGKLMDIDEGQVH